MLIDSVQTGPETFVELHLRAGKYPEIKMLTPGKLFGSRAALIEVGSTQFKTREAAEAAFARIKERANV